MNGVSTWLVNNIPIVVAVVIVFVFALSFYAVRRIGADLRRPPRR